MSSPELVKEARAISSTLRRHNETHTTELEESKDQLEESIKGQKNSEESLAALEKEANAFREESSGLRKDLEKAGLDLSGLRQSLKNSNEESDKEILKWKKKASRAEKTVVVLGVVGGVVGIIALGEGLLLALGK